MTAARQRTLIGVIGSGQASPVGIDSAYRVGQLLAEHGAVLVCGGLGGIMEAASRGCVEAGGLVVGILPGASSAGANPFVTLPIVTNMGHARNVIIAHSAAALIAIEGGYGTISEMAVGLKLRKKVVQLHPLMALPGVLLAETPEQAVLQALSGATEGDSHERC